MDNKNNKKKRSFIPQTIGNALRKINRKFPSKLAKIEFIINSKWPEIVGTYFKDFSEPKNITSSKDFENEIGETFYKNILNVSVNPSAAIEFQHFKDKIIEKINSFFGYKAITDLRIHQNFTTFKSNIEKLNSRKKELNSFEKELIFNKVNNLKNSDLKEALINLGSNIKQRND